MRQSEKLGLSTPMLSITNFDLPSLHLLHKEIAITLKDAEFHLSEFNDDQQQVALLLDSIEVFKQLACIFEMISLKGAQILSSALQDGLQQLYDTENNNDIALIMDLSEAIMTLDRYVEFVLLTETVEPTLLAPIINKLYAHHSKEPIDEDYFSRFGSSSVVIANPEQNFEPLSALDLDGELLTHAYRSGLAVALANTDGEVSTADQPKIEAMSAACALIATHSQSLFWQAANAMVTDIEDILPLNIRHKHTLIYLEQQFQNYLPVMDTRFADLVSLACQRNHAKAEQLCEQYARNTLDSTQRERLRGFLFGPNREVVDTLHTLFQVQINNIKEKVDSYSRGNFSNFAVTASKAQATAIANDLLELSSTLRLLVLDNAATAIQNAGQAVMQWQKPSPDDFDHLLLALMSAENAMITMTEMHTPGEIYLPISNADISLNQLNSAYETLLKESRVTLVHAEQIIDDYLATPEDNPLILQNIPEMLYRVAGALRFLQLSISSTMLNQLAKFLEQRFASNLPFNEDILANIADVMMCIDYYLENSQHNRPISKQSLNVGQYSLSQLLAA